MKTLLNLRSLRKHDTWTREELTRHQQKALGGLRLHAYENSPFYQSYHKGLFSADYNELPVTTKGMLMQNFDSFVTDPEIKIQDVRKLIESKSGDQYLEKYWINTTAGSTGQPGIFLFNDEEWRTVLASFAKAQEWSGLEVSLFHRTKRAIVSSTAPTYMSALVGRTIDNFLMPTLRLDATLQIREITDRLNDWQPEMLVSYASMARILAREQQDGNLSINPKVVFTSSEVLTNDTRKLIREVWGTEVFNEYASTETATIAAECEYHRLHVFEDLLIVEVVDESNKPVPDGEFGEKLLVTVLFNYTQPLIRYEISDSVKLSSEKCPCGRHTRIISAIQGRKEDILSFISVTGEKIDLHPNVFHGMMENVAASSWQIIRHPDKVQVLLAGLPRSESIAADLTSTFETLFRGKGIVIPVQIDFVTQIPKKKSGKAPLIVNAAAEPVLAKV